MTNQEIGQYLLDGLKSAGADKADCNIEKKRIDELNVADGKLSLLRTIFSTTVVMKAIRNSKHGVIAVNSSDQETLDKAIGECMEASSVSIADDAEDIAELTENCSVGQEGEINLEKLNERLNELIQDAKNKYPKVNLAEINASYNTGSRVHMNTNGVIMEEHFGSYSISVMFSARDKETSSSIFGYGFTTEDLGRPFIEIGVLDEMLATAEKSIYPKQFEGKFQGTLLVTPAALEGLLFTMQGLLLNDGSLIDGTSQWKDALGKKVADESLTVSSKYFEEGLVTSGSLITDDGYLKENLTVIDQGTLSSFLLSRFGSKKTGKPRSKNYGGYYVVNPGDKSLEEIIASIDNGIVLGYISGNQPTSSGEVSGVAKNSFLIKNGEIKEAITETMISFNLLDALKNIRGISKEQTCNGFHKLPWVAFDGVVISGK